eukprot:1926829-Rhodomonas_salina.1
MAARGDAKGAKAPLPGDSSRIRADPSRSLNKSSPAKASTLASGAKSAPAKPRTATAGAVGAKTAAKPKAAVGAKSSAPSKVNTEKRNRDLQYKALLDKDMHAKRKADILESFKKLQVMSVEDLQVELIVCIRAQHYRDALMYSEIILEKDPGNALVAQFQPLLANLSVQANVALGDEDEDEDDAEGDEEGGAEDKEEEDDGADDDDDDDDDEDSDGDSNSDDPETAWMWSDTWRTDPDDGPEEGPSTEEKTEGGPAAGPKADKLSPS